MSKAEFTRKYNALTNEQKAEIKAYYTDTMNGAVFTNTFTAAEERLLWIRDIEND